MIEKKDRKMIISALKTCKEVVTAVETLEEEIRIISKRSRNALRSIELDIEDYFNMDIDDIDINYDDDDDDDDDDNKGKRL